MTRSALMPAVPEIDDVEFGRGLPRWFDAMAAGATLVVLLPVLLLAAVAVLLSSRGPVLFYHARMGMNGRTFQFIKFRSMRQNTKAFQVTAAGDPLITPVGKVLRRTKIDELPSLWNVVRGEMALVGPRPEGAALVDLSDPLWIDVLRVRPGITDPVTISLRNEEAVLARARSAFPDIEVFYHELQRWKLRGYVDYLRRRTPASDVVVLIHTLLAIIGIKAPMGPSHDDIFGPAPNSRGGRSTS